MKNIFTMAILAAAIATSSIAYAKELSPQQQEIKKLTAELKAKRAVLKESSKEERKIKAQKALDKAQKNLAKFS